MRKQEILIFAAVVVVVLIIALVITLQSFISTSEPSPSPQATSKPPTPVFNNFASPQVKPSLAPSLPPTSQVTKEEIINQLPFQSEIFNVEYLSVNDHFVVTIKKNPYQENVTQAESWFKDQGIDPTQLNIYWNAFPEVQR